MYVKSVCMYVLPSGQHSLGQMTQVFELGRNRPIYTHFQVFLELLLSTKLSLCCLA